MWIKIKKLQPLSNCFKQVLSIYLFKFKNGIAMELVLVYALSTLNRFHTMFWCFNCLLKIRKCRLFNELDKKTSRALSRMPFWAISPFKTGRQTNNKHKWRSYKYLSRKGGSSECKFWSFYIPKRVINQFCLLMKN